MLSDKIATAISEDNLVLRVFLDFSNTFHTVDHSIFLKKLYKYGIRGIAHDWLQRYLYNRRQFVFFNHCSDMNDITCGVPHGPLLFLLYVNDIVEVSSVLIPIWYADDTILFVIGKNVNVLNYNMNNELAKLVQWLEL